MHRNSLRPIVETNEVELYGQGNARDALDNLVTGEPKPAADGAPTVAGTLTRQKWEAGRNQVQCVYTTARMATISYAANLHRRRSDGATSDRDIQSEIWRPHQLPPRIISLATL